MKKLLFVLFLVGLHFNLSVSASASIFKHTGKKTAAAHKAKQLPQVCSGVKAAAAPGISKNTEAQLSRALETAAKHAQAEEALSTQKRLLAELLNKGYNAFLKAPEMAIPYQAPRAEIKPKHGYLVLDGTQTEFDISPLDYYAILLGNLQTQKFHPELFTYKKFALNKLSYEEVTLYAYLRHQIIHQLKNLKRLLRTNAPVVKIRGALHQLEYHLIQMTRFMAKRPETFAQTLTQLRQTGWQAPSSLAQDLQTAAH